MTDYLHELSVVAARYFKQHPEKAEILEGTVELTASAIHSHIENDPHLQQSLADLVDYTPSRWLLCQEIPVVRQRREIHKRPDTKFDGEDPYAWARTNSLQGLCLSGGGIRSATFNLGVLQGLAKLKLLSHFDYMSSVSGGGYIHEWLAAWIKREEQEQSNRANRAGNHYVPGSGFEEVENRLSPLPSGTQFASHPEPVRWLRRYSNYLTPQKGIFTADTWVALAVWLRNTFLNQLILISGFFFVLLMLDFIGEYIPCLPAPWSVVFPISLFLLAIAVIAIELQREYRRIRFMDEHKLDHQDPEPPRRWGGEKTIQAFVVLPILLACVLHLGALPWPAVESFSITNPTSKDLTVFALLWLLVAAAATAGASIRAYKILNIIPDLITIKSWTSRAWQAARVGINGIGGLVVMNAAVSAVAGTLLFKVVCWLLGSIPAKVGDAEYWRFQSAFGPPLLFTVPFFTIVIGAGLVGRDFPDWLREWLARVRGWALLFGLSWALFFGIALLGPYFVHWLIAPVKLAATVGWVATTAGSVLAGKSNKTSGKATEGAARSAGLDILAKVGPYVFVLGSLLVLSVGVKYCLDHTASNTLNRTLLILLPAGIFALFGWRVDVNDFSMNPFYRNRLTRCYLGASNRHRNPNPLTGFDDRDTRGMQISRLTPGGGYTGPFPIVCTAINLTFGEDLAWQERKAASFAFTPVCSGYEVGWTAAKPGKPLNCCGFVPTYGYAFPEGGINMATAVAISGAAASPNWGYHTNPATAFLMTAFNVRLGWWLFNPRRSDINASASPRFAPLELTKELLGIANDASKFVYLSDGGHFDNMGLYELVRRRCYRILICDSEQDENYFFEGIANAVRKCRIDFGVEITLDLSRLRPVPLTGNCQSHWAEGKIRYPETPSGEEHEGEILYIKSSLTGAGEYCLAQVKTAELPTEPIDIINYKFAHQHFPHDTTANQWFTESQFESYRRLGYHVIDEVNRCGKCKNF
jgi:Patatin-like phospholipase